MFYCSSMDIISISNNVLGVLKEQVKVELWKLSAAKLIALYKAHLTTSTYTKPI